MTMRSLIPVMFLALQLSACGGGGLWLFEGDEPSAATETTATAAASGSSASAGAAATSTGSSTGSSSASTTTTGSSAGTAATTGSVPACNTAGYVAGSVEAPSAAQWAAYAGTYDGDEGAYSTGSGVFIKSGSATVTLGNAGALTYKGASYTITSACIDKVAGPYGKIFYVVAGNGHLDLADKADATLGSAWGVALTDGTTIFTKGIKR